MDLCEPFLRVPKPSCNIAPGRFVKHLSIAACFSTQCILDCFRLFSQGPLSDGSADDKATPDSLPLVERLSLQLPAGFFAKTFERKWALLRGPPGARDVFQKIWSWRHVVRLADREAMGSTVCACSNPVKANGLSSSVVGCLRGLLRGFSTGDLQAGPKCVWRGRS